MKLRVLMLVPISKWQAIFSEARSAAILKCLCHYGVLSQKKRTVASFGAARLRSFPAFMWESCRCSLGFRSLGYSCSTSICKGQRLSPSPVFPASTLHFPYHLLTPRCSEPALMSNSSEILPVDDVQMELVESWWTGIPA